ncbi:hypothetical protein JRO89_XS06G0119300 [Xanthoceras sorbifolium]|uniref:Uncharacterized protein n=1 Tax=Xanthoceras sorbifolium TaxID=99658 RepID=A0ABQ8HXT3_9ROSI|nr:hypothetical protein JRO89_XS06G0119300 [Xanthoceras sorbifolium]
MDPMQQSSTQQSLSVPTAPSRDSPNSDISSDSSVQNVDVSSLQQTGVGSAHLGEEHVAYRRLDFPTIKLSVIGGRPFSCGGEQIFRKKLLSARYVVHYGNFSHSRQSFF